MSAKGASEGEVKEGGMRGGGGGGGGRLGAGATGNVVMLESTEEALKGC